MSLPKNGHLIAKIEIKYKNPNQNKPPTSHDIQTRHLHEYDAPEFSQSYITLPKHTFFRVAFQYQIPITCFYLIN